MVYKIGSWAPQTCYSEPFLVTGEGVLGINPALNLQLYVEEEDDLLLSQVFLSMRKAWTVNHWVKLFQWIVTSRSAALFDGVHISILLPRILLNTCITHSTNVIVFPVPEITKNVYDSLNVTKSSNVMVSWIPSKQSIMIKTMYCDKNLCWNQKLQWLNQFS